MSAATKSVTTQRRQQAAASQLLEVSMAHLEGAKMATTNASWECRCYSVVLCISYMSVHTVLLIQWNSLSWWQWLQYDNNNHYEDDNNDTCNHSANHPSPASTPVITRAPIVIPYPRVGARLSCVWPGATTHQRASLAPNLLWLRLSKCFQAES